MSSYKIISGVSFLAVLFGLLSSFFTVDQTQQALILQFGEPKRLINKPGLNFKIPFIQNIVYLDKRILNLDNEPQEVIAADQKRLIVDAFARFQIIDPLKFYISVGNERVARSRLATVINSRIRNVLGQQELQTLLSKDRSKQMSLIQVGVNAEAQKFGIEIVDASEIISPITLTSFELSGVLEFEFMDESEVEVKETKKEFKPFTIEVKFETQDEVYNMIHLLSATNIEIKYDDAPKITITICLLSKGGNPNFTFT